MTKTEPGGELERSLLVSVISVSFDAVLGRASPAVRSTLGSSTGVGLLV